MNVLDSARLVIYRMNKKGLEIFLVNTGEGENNQWQIPQGQFTQSNQVHADDRLIELDPVQQENGQMEQGWAIEGDWHEIPSIRKMLRDDVRIVKDQIKQRFPELEKGTYFAVKEAFKQVMPSEYAMLKELKEIMTDRNQAKYI
ncbi:MAG: hypothetical protein AAFP19_09180 [Bacteroidota bacterium]